MEELRKKYQWDKVKIIDDLYYMSSYGVHQCLSASKKLKYFLY